MTWSGSISSWLSPSWCGQALAFKWSVKITGGCATCRNQVYVNLRSGASFQRPTEAAHREPSVVSSHVIRSVLFDFTWRDVGHANDRNILDKKMKITTDLRFCDVVGCPGRRWNCTASTWTKATSGNRSDTLLRSISSRNHLRCTNCRPVKEISIVLSLTEILWLNLLIFKQKW